MSVSQEEILYQHSDTHIWSLGKSLWLDLQTWELSIVNLYIGFKVKGLDEIPKGV